MIDQILVIVGITFLVLVSPGPDIVIVMRNTLLGGRRAGLQTSAGILAGNMVHITYCVLGIGWLISKSIFAFTILKYAGAAYLIYLGIVSFRSGDQALKPNAAVPGRSNRACASHSGSSSSSRWITRSFVAVSSDSSTSCTGSLAHCLCFSASG